MYILHNNCQMYIWIPLGPCVSSGHDVSEPGSKPFTTLLRARAPACLHDPLHTYCNALTPVAARQPHITQMNRPRYTANLCDLCVNLPHAQNGHIGVDQAQT